MEPIIRPAIVAALAKDRPHYTRSGRSKLYPSGAGECHTGRRELLRINDAPSTPFPFRVKEAMNDGNVYEASTLALLQDFYGEENVLSQLALRNDYWSGKTDMVIYHKTPQVIIVEHKATGDKWFDYKGNLPKYAHVFQLAKYKSMYFAEFGFVPDLRLYYRSWGQWAEFQLDVQPEQIVYDGVVFNGKTVNPRTNSININLDAYTRRLEWFYDKNRIPHRVAPEDMESAGCTFKGEPSCGFFSHCWPREKIWSEIEAEK